jgi:hypothetical protein
MADADTLGLNKGACAAPRAAAPGCDSSGDSHRPPPTCRSLTSQLGLAAELEGRSAKSGRWGIGCNTAAKPPDNGWHVQTDMEHRPSARPATDGPGQLANPMDLMISTTAEQASRPLGAVPHPRSAAPASAGQDR